MSNPSPDDVCPILPAPADNCRAADEHKPDQAAPQSVSSSSRSDSEARHALKLLATVVDLLPVGVTVESAHGGTLFANDAAAELSCGASPPAGLARAADGAPITTVEERIVGPDGDRTILRRRRTAQILGQPVVLSASVDFTERKEAEIALSKRAYFDDLTGLPNRILIQEQVEQLLANSEAPARFALAFLDIDNFKHINDYYTHAIGDALLVKVAQRIAGLIRPTDILSRISGDEFLLVITPLDDDDLLAEQVNNLLQQIKEPFLIEGFEIFTSASIGLSIHPDHGLNYEMLRRAADTAMYRIKQGHKGDAVLFNSDMGRAMRTRMAQEQRLRLAVRDGRFCCAFQPKVDIRTEEVVGVEALIRLRDENGDIQAPSGFIGLATELGLIDDLSYLALGQIVRSMDLIDEAFGPQATISINIAAKQAGNPNFMRAFCEELRATSYPERFMIEVTEDAFVAQSLFQAQVLPLLRDIGARVSIDDFGTGYSSLATLADMTADEIKIDRSFITDIHKRSRSQSILKAIEALSDSLGIAVIAEGVETTEEVTFLQAATRIRFAQGYYFSKPVLMEDLSPVKRHLGSARAFSETRERSPLRARR